MEEEIQDTELDRIQKEVEEKKSLAKDKKLDELLGSIYSDIWLPYSHLSLKLSNQDTSKQERYFHPESTLIFGNKIQNEITYEDINVIEFILNKTNYKIAGHYAGDDLIIDLYLNDSKVFGIRGFEKRWNITAYVNDDWVNDFKKIKTHLEKTKEQIRIENNEKKILEAKESFGIS